jgi:hypothetical protein
MQCSGIGMVRLKGGHALGVCTYIMCMMAWPGVCCAAVCRVQFIGQLELESSVTGLG